MTEPNFYESPEDALRNQMNLSTDWVMRDFPAMKEEFFTQLTELIGEGNYKILSSHSRNFQCKTDEDGKTSSEKLPFNLIRATLFINQQGRENLRNYAERVRV